MKGGEYMGSVPDVGQTIISSLNNGIFAVLNFIPKFVAGVVILLLGIIIASIIKQVVVEIFKALRIEAFLRRYGVPEMKEEFSWTNIFAAIIRWFVIIIFLIPTADVWGLPQIITVLNQFLLYLPNVFVAAIIAVVGLVFAKLARDVVFASTRKISVDSAHTVSSVAQWAVIVFVILAVLNQLGVASDLVRILFTGFVAMIAIAGGIAFGLGGQDSAKDALNSLRKKLK